MNDRSACDDSIIGGKIRSPDILFHNEKPQRENIVEYSLETFISIVRTHISMKNEIEARDTVFRMKFDIEKRRQIAPWFSQERNSLRQEEFDIWHSLQENKFSEKETIEKITGLMEQYYGQRYSLQNP